MSDQDAVTREWDAVAGDWDDLATSYAQSFSDTLESKQYLPKGDDAVVLDFGCGTGLLTEKLQDKCQKIIAVDASPQMIQQLEEKIKAREWNNVQAMTAILASPSVADAMVEEYCNRFDLIVASSVFNFIPDKDLSRTLQVLARLLKPGGRLCHSDWPKDDGEHINGMTEEKAQRLYHNAGLTMVEMGIVEFKSGAHDSAPVFFGVAAH
jgi:ubiquinone/menaquinone biosynthesis C-methylase UbiE